jgi:hypothetical protein
MPSSLTEVTEITTALGMLDPDLHRALGTKPEVLRHVPDTVWERLVRSHQDSQHVESFRTSFANGRAFLAARDGLRGRPPLVVEWKGPHRPPGDDVIPADLRIDHVFLVSCKYLSKLLVNSGPQRLFERLLVGERRSSTNWFALTAPCEYQALYDAAVGHLDRRDLPAEVGSLSRAHQDALKQGLSQRTWPEPLRPAWSALCRTVASESAARWQAAVTSPRDALRLLWRLLRISTATYFVLGTDRGAHLRLRIDSAWDWVQAYDLRGFEVQARPAGQPEVGWRATIRRRAGGSDTVVEGHVEVRWSHGRFRGVPEAKVYLDTPHAAVPGYNALR